MKVVPVLSIACDIEQAVPPKTQSPGFGDTRVLDKADLLGVYNQLAFPLTV